MTITRQGILALVTLFTTVIAAAWVLPALGVVTHDSGPHSASDGA